MARFEILDPTAQARAHLVVYDYESQRMSITQLLIIPPQMSITELAPLLQILEKIELDKHPIVENPDTSVVGETVHPETDPEQTIVGHSEDTQLVREPEKLLLDQPAQGQTTELQGGSETVVQNMLN